jgi:hypothetical protein
MLVFKFIFSKINLNGVQKKREKLKMGLKPNLMNADFGGPMKKIFFIMTMSLALVGCNNQDTKLKNNQTEGHERDNTGINVRDRNQATKTPLDQSENEGDRAITQKIRQAIMADDSLSTNAKNIKIITVNGVVTLRGPVANQQEKDAIAKKVNNVQGIFKVENQLDVTRINN